jgi:hypothetical protein
VLTNDEALTGMEMVAPCGVVSCWVAYGALNPGV